MNHIEGRPRTLVRRAFRVLEWCLGIAGTWSRSQCWEWRLAWFVDLMHWPIAVFLVTAGTWMPSLLFNCVVAVVILAQAAVMGCPVRVVSGYLRRRVDPTFFQTSGLVAAIYTRWGRARALPVLAVGIAFGIVAITWTVR